MNINELKAFIEGMEIVAGSGGITDDQWQEVKNRIMELQEHINLAPYYPANPWQFPNYGTTDQPLRWQPYTTCISNASGNN